MHITEPTTPWALGAVAVFALTVAYKAFLQKIRTPPARTLYAVLAGVCIIATLVPTTVVRPIGTIYRVHVTVVDSHDVPVEGATVFADTSHEAKAAANGRVELAIPSGALPQDHRVTLYADKPQAFLHGGRN